MKTTSIKQLKTHLTFLLILTLCPFINVHGGNGSKEKVTQIFVAGFINSNEAVYRTAMVRLYDKNEVIDSIAPDEEGGFYFQLPANSHCTIEIEREGYVKKLVSISTKLTEERKRLPMFEFTIDLTKEEEYNGVDISDLDFPAAVVSYSSDKRKLMYSAKYASFMNKEQQRLLAEAQAKENRVAVTY
jgi:hypothetical protein